jgi:rhodanese-related sulfurtransferase
VRPTVELEEVGKVKGCINVPIMNAKWKFDSKENKRVMEKSENPDFVKQVEKAIPDKDTPIMVGCSDGTTYSIDALMALEDAGYTTMVGLKGGFYAWFRVFDNKLNRRKSGEYAEQYTHDGDSCGIHSSGAGFARVDAIEQWVPPKF